MFWSELPAVWTRLELATSAVTGRHSNQTELPDQNLVSPVRCFDGANVDVFLIYTNKVQRKLAKKTKKHITIVSRLPIVAVA